jgi:tetrahedral aminopeptidase
MLELTPFLKELLSLPGLSGYESPVRDKLIKAWRPLVDELETSPLGSLHGLRKGHGEEPRPSILLAAHMDAIGLMTTSIEEGFLHITEVGGIDHRILPGQQVTVHARRDLPGVIIQPPPALLPDDISGKPVPMQYLLVDTGLTVEEVNKLVRPGDIISFAQPPLELSGDTMAGHSLDNRASVAAVTLCLQELTNIRHKWDVWAVATSQEEETLGGAKTSSYAIRPDLAIAIDVTFAKGPGTPDHGTFPLDDGLTLGWGANMHPVLYTKFKELAEQLDIPNHIEIMPGRSGTDALALQVTAEGIPTMVIGIPLRYMHTPVELVALRSITRTARLLSEFIKSLDSKFVETINWED